MKRFTLLVWLLLASMVWAVDPPKVPKEVQAQPGAFIVVKPESSGMIQWYPIDPGLSILPPGLLQDKNTLIAIAPKQGRYRLLCWTAQGDEPSAASQVVVVVGDAPDPNPGPNPPDPDVPDKFGLIKASREGLAKVSGAKEVDIKKLAQAQRSLASSIAAGAVVTPVAILAAWREHNNKAVDSEVWSPWGQMVTAQVESQYKTGKLVDKDSWRDAFNDIAKGLE